MNKTIENLELKTATNDLVFKYVMKRNKEIIQKIIEEVTDIKVTTIEFLDTHYENNFYKKYQISDLVLNVNDNYLINLEMDNTPSEAKRLLYCGNLLNFQLESGETYETLKPVIQIGFDNYHYFDNLDEYNKIKFMNERKQIDNEYLNKIRICLPNINLNCYNKEKLSELEKICLIIQSRYEDERNEIAQGSEVLEKMVKTINEATKKASLMELMHRYDYNEIQRTFDLYEAKKEGKIEGKIEGKTEIAKNMLNNGLNPELISKITNLDKNYIETLL